MGIFNVMFRMLFGALTPKVGKVRDKRVGGKERMDDEEGEFEGLMQASFEEGIRNLYRERPEQVEWVMKISRIAQRKDRKGEINGYPVCVAGFHPILERHDDGLFVSFTIEMFYRKGECWVPVVVGVTRMHSDATPFSYGAVDMNEQLPVSPVCTTLPPEDVVVRDLGFPGDG